MEHIKKNLSKPTDWLLLGVVIVLTVLVFCSRTVEKLGNTVNKQAIMSQDQVLSPGFTDIHNRLKKGIIVMWSGADTDVPAGWVLCDGTNNTPDLRGRFILGSGNDIPTLAYIMKL